MGGRCLSPHGKALAAKLATGTRSPSTGSSLSAPGPLSVPPSKLPLGTQALDSDPSPGTTPSPRSLFLHWVPLSGDPSMGPCGLTSMETRQPCMAEKP